MNLAAPFANAWHYRELIRAVVRRELAVRFRGTVFGWLWAIFGPLLMLGAYTVVFSHAVGVPASAKAGGIGLGLWVARQIAEARADRERLAEVERGHDDAAPGERLVDHRVQHPVAAAPGAAVHFHDQRERLHAPAAVHLERAAHRSAADEAAAALSAPERLVPSSLHGTLRSDVGG